MIADSIWLDQII